MKKLKTKLLFSIYLLLTISFLVKYNSKPISKYSDSETIVRGVITECNFKNNITNMIVKGKEKILIKYDKSKCEIGTNISAVGKIVKPKENKNFYLFNYKKYLLSKKINYIFIADNIRVTNKKIKLIYRIKNNIIKHINKYKSKVYLKTFILGDKTEIDDNIFESYQNNGVIYLFSISGSQISIIIFIITYISERIVRSKKMQLAIIFSCLIIYLFLTSFSISILRSIFCFMLIKINKELNINIKTFCVYFLVLLLLLNINPFYLYNVGFVLSFTVSFYLVLFRKIINKYSNYFSKIFVISLIAFLASSPILINSFFHLNLLSPLASIFFTPLILLVVFPLCLLAIFVKPLDTILYKIIQIVEKTSVKIEKIKMLDINLPYVSVLGIIIYYLIITAILYMYQNKNKNFLYIFLVLIILHHNKNVFDKTSLFTTLDVGQGDSLLIKLQQNRGNILIDTGGEMFKDNTYNLSKNVTIPYLKAEGINKLNYLIITHGDYDHMGEAINLVNNFKVEEVIFNCGLYNDLEKKLIKVLDKKKIKYYSCIKELNIDKNKFYFLQTKEYDNENDNSNVIYTELNDYKFMFMGDASSTTEKEIMSIYNLPDIDVLKVGHHGSKTSSSEEFINEINTKYSVISVGKNNMYGHPNKEVLDNLDNSKIFRTDIDGSIMFKIKNNKMKIETCSP